MTAISGSGTSFLERLRDRLDPGPAAPATAPGAEAAAPGRRLHPLLVDAAVQHVFTLQRLGGTPDAAMLRRLAADSVPAPGFLDRQGRILSRGPRCEVLRQIGATGARSALKALTPIATPTQAMFEALLGGLRRDLAGMSREDLLALREAAGWLEGVVAMAFTTAEIDRALASGQVWAPFAAMLGIELVGRDEDLAALAAFLGFRLDRDGKPAQAPLTAHRLLLVEGVGGIGKSALIAQLLLRLGAADGVPRFPFAYLACDDPALDITQPDRLLDAAAGQIIVQLRLADPASDAAAAADAAHERFRDSLRQQAAALDEAARRSSSADSMDARLARIRGAATGVVSGFADFATLTCAAMAHDGRRPPCLLVIDTFEEVQFRSPERLAAFWGLVAQLMGDAPDLRLVIAGRAPLAQPDLPFAVARLALNELSHAAAVDLLARETGQDGGTLDGLARQIGGNPLNLRLAARVIAEDQPGRRGIAGLTTRRWGFLRVSNELIRGQLYRRLLDHIHDPRVRALAHPGMILRRITPAIIQSVLADICEIDLAGPEDAGQLFEALAAEHTLVRRADDGSLRYREDVRRPVLSLLSNERPDLTRRTHEAAHRFYADQPDTISAAEAIYHGLMLGLDGWLLDLLWQPAAADHLLGAIEELPPAGVVWLAGHTDIDLPDAYREAASLEEWERIVGPRALALLQEAGSAEVLSMLSEREARSPLSPLVSIEARCLISLGEHGAAQALLERALETAPLDGNPGRKAEYLWLLAQSLWGAGSMSEAALALDEMAVQAGRLTSPVPLVQGLGAWLALHPEGGAGAEDRRAALAEALARCSDQDLQREPDVIRRGFSHLDAAGAARLTRPALTSLAGLFDIVARPDAFRPSAAHLQAIRDLARAAADRPATGELGAQVDALLSRQPLTTADLLSLLGVLRRPLAGNADGTRDPVAALAAQMLWHVAQMETATLSTASLAGIDAYRTPWEAETSYLAATA